MTESDETPLPVLRTIADLRACLTEWRREALTVGFVPTMGALHAGHLALVERARAENDRVIASVFVNPKQFSPGEDLESYPRREGRDAEKLAAAECDTMFAPSAAEMYPDGFATKVTVDGISEGLCGATRPNFFTGIATVVAKLFILIGPDRAYFGEKDYQQLLLIRRMARDLGMPVDVVGCPVVRDDDGLALSSRNDYLSAEERHRALTLPATLSEMARRLSEDGGATAVAQALADGRKRLESAGFTLDYLEIRDAETLEPLTVVDRPARVLAGGYLGGTRLIDNVPVMPSAD